MTSAAIKEQNAKVKSQLEKIGRQEDGGTVRVYTTPSALQRIERPYTALQRIERPYTALQRIERPYTALQRIERPYTAHSVRREY